MLEQFSLRIKHNAFVGAKNWKKYFILINFYDKIEYYFNFCKKLNMNNQ
jgi:hypothetical protein